MAISTRDGHAFFSFFQRKKTLQTQDHDKLLQIMAKADQICE